MLLFALRPTRLADADALAFHVRHELAVQTPAERVFALLATGEGQREWARDFRRTTWFDGGEHATGSVRDIHLRWIVTRERFLAWEPGRRFAFSADAMSVPLARALVEDIRIEPAGTQACTLDWRVHYTPRSALAPVARRLHERVFTPLFGDFARGLATYAERHPARAGSA